MDSWLSLLPPLVAIALAIVTRQVVISLFLGVWMGWTILAGGNPLVGLADSLGALVDVFKSTSNTYVILFSALVGALVTLTQRSGGVEGFVAWMRSLNIGHSRRSAGMVAWVTGVVVFVETSITCLVVGAVARPLCDRQRVSREKLAYICDSTSAPVCVLVPLNAWGAYVMGLLSQQGVERPLPLMLEAIPLNFYALTALVMTLVVILSGRDFGPMRAAEARAREHGKLLADGATPMISSDVLAMDTKPGVTPRAINMLLPIGTMIVMMPVGLYITGRTALGPAVEPTLFDILGSGSGSTSVFWAVLAAITVAAGLYLGQRLMTLREVVDLAFKGAGGLVPMAAVMMLAFAINATCNALGTGTFVAAISQEILVPGLVPVVLFLVSCFIAFSTGTSWGTFGIMMPIGVAMAGDSGLAVAVAAILGGGVFGDHCSPISDTTVVSSMATASDHVDHVRTQLPYALVCAAVALVGYGIAGLFV